MKLFLQKCDKIFDDFFNIIINVDGREADDNEINTIISMYKDLSFVLDGVFSLARSPNGSMNEENVSLLRRLVKAVLKMWRNLRMSMSGPKIHALEDHLLQQIERHKGISDFVGDFVEQSHQHGLKDELRTRGLDRARVFLSHLNWEYVCRCPCFALGIRELRIACSRQSC